MDRKMMMMMMMKTGGGAKTNTRLRETDGTTSVSNSLNNISVSGLHTRQLAAYFAAFGVRAHLQLSTGS